ncbi:MAG: hypothetical protein QOE75_620 [Solirubrobacterales bacterium]|nr:hypothetical protein [Solirubrobacterales bacterium]
MAAFNVAVALDELETDVLQACCRESEWPARVAAGVYAGVDFAIARPEIARELATERSLADGSFDDYSRLVGRLTGFIRVHAPVEARLPAATDEALVAGMVGLVGDHVRIGRLDRLAELRPELVLLTLLPYLGFEEAQSWANRTAK